MTQAPKKPCSKPGCSNLTHSQFCEAHDEYGLKVKKERQKLKKTDSFYGSARWKRFRKWYGMKNPLCEDCLAVGIVRKMYCVDHVVEIQDCGALTSEDNSRSLCRVCHQIKTNAVKRERLK